MGLPRRKSQPVPEVVTFPCGVQCGWCNSAGCLFCLNARMDLEARHLDREQAAGLVAAMKDNPKDKMTRLVYADWLEDNGFYSAAEIIRQGSAGRRKAR